MKNADFWDKTHCSPLKIYPRFGGIYRLHPQGKKINEPRNYNEAGSKQFPLFLLPVS
jgi:hypothetical protein